MPRRNNIEDLVAAEVAFRDSDESEPVDDSPMRSNAEKTSKRRKRDDDLPVPQDEEKPDYGKRMDELLSKLAEQDKKLQAFIAGEADKLTKAEQLREERKQQREARRQQKLKEREDFWAKKNREIEDLVAKQTGQKQRETEKKYDDTIRQVHWARLEY